MEKGKGAEEDGKAVRFMFFIYCPDKERQDVKSFFDYKPEVYYCPFCFKAKCSFIILPAFSLL